MKRIRARARGRAAPIQKPFSQLTIVLRDTSQTAEAA
jgi:large subunit ribosomal protein L22